VGGGVIRATPRRVSRKRDKTYFGYKAHLAVDEESGLVRQAEMTSTNVHDSRLGEALIQGDEQGFFADRAYDSQALREARLVDGIAWKVKHPRYPLETWQSSTTPGRQHCADLGTRGRNDRAWLSRAGIFDPQ
jgi:IS5 family transposase